MGCMRRKVEMWEICVSGDSGAFCEPGGTGVSATFCEPGETGESGDFLRIWCIW